jgi:flagellin
VPQTINTNLVSLNAQRSLNSSQNLLSTSMARLSSGLRINSAKDDAAGLAISERMNTQVRGMSVAMRNANDGISLGQVAEGALGRVGDILQRMRELAVQAANTTNNTGDRAALNTEYMQMAAEASRTLEGTRFNNLNILANSASTAYQVGAGTSTTLDQITVAGFAWTAVANSLTAAVGAAASTPPTAGITGSDGTAALAAISAIDSALDTINTERATWGAVMNRFENVISTLQVAVENQAAARSRIMDADYAAETANLSRAQILQQAGNAMVAQANQLPQQVLQLLQR